MGVVGAGLDVTPEQRLAAVGIAVMRIPVVIPTKLDWIAMLLLIGVFGFFAQILLVMGLQRETAGRGTMALYVQIVFTTAFERIFFHSTPPLLSIAGIFIIMSSAIYVAIAKNSNIASEKRRQSAINSAEDTSLEEGLPENEEEQH
ncbi:hypothetical protein EW026_g4101 [Hermanssonia centrifuga]|uniref:EamA domain-containing protein n=1 Tax=Hermanssonia centrifuga TaxID=98765 RepID=A0A4S4KJH1_9APHY|nr:hypothetical protein EW026_g4101 [Hermanssonia centrifuga]